MAATRRTLAIDIDAHWVRAVLAVRNGSRIRVRRTLVAPVPQGLGADDAAALGAWMRRELAAAGFPSQKATLAISREQVAIKRITLPTTDDRELPEMTRLALQRDLPFDAASAAIDFVRLGRSDSATTVLAVAVPQRMLDFARQVARGAGLGIERVSLRNMGSAALLATLPRERAGGILAVDITPRRVEFSVVVDGAIRFSRAGDLPEITDPGQLAEAVITETRRTWMSYRIVEDSDDVSRAVVIGDPEVSGQAAGAIGEILKVGAEVLREHPLVDTRGHDMDGAWPLAGLLLERSLGGASIDLVHPRRPPDVAGRKRQLALAAAGLAVVLGMGAFTAGRLSLKRLQEDVGSLETRRGVLGPQYMRYGRDLYKLSHLEQWESAQAEWLDHLGYLVELAPPGDRLVLDSWSGSLSFGGVRFDRTTERLSAPIEIRVVVEGEAADRATADVFRGALVAAETYQITTTGPDTRAGRRLPYAFSYQLRTTACEPPQAPPEGAEAPAVAAGDRAVPAGEGAP